MSISVRRVENSVDFGTYSSNAKRLRSIYFRRRRISICDRRCIVTKKIRQGTRGTEYQLYAECNATELLDDQTRIFGVGPLCQIFKASFISQTNLGSHRSPGPQNPSLRSQNYIRKTLVG